MRSRNGENLHGRLFQQSEQEQGMAMAEQLLARLRHDDVNRVQRRKHQRLEQQQRMIATDSCR